MAVWKATERASKQAQHRDPDRQAAMKYLQAGGA